MSCVAVVLLAAIPAACAGSPEAGGLPDARESTIPAGTPGAVVPIEAQPEFWPCGAEHPQPGRLIRHDPAGAGPVWDVPVPVQVETIAVVEGNLHLSDGVGLDIAVDHATGRLTFPTREDERRTPYSPARSDGGDFDDRTSQALSSIGLDIAAGLVADATWIDADVIVLIVFPGAECA